MATPTRQDDLGLALEATLPVSIEPASGDVRSLATAHEVANDTLLNALQDIEEHPVHEHAEEHSTLAQEVARLDRKLSLLMTMVGQIWSSQLRLPDPVAIRMTAHTLEGPSAVALPPNGFVTVRLYLAPEFPLPLTLVARVVECHAEAGGFRIRLAWEAMSPALAGALEKMIFRHHRRTVASARRA
jgi:hypothetical protein